MPLPLLTLDSTRVVAYQRLQASAASPGCQNIILPDGRVLSAKSDGSDGAPVGTVPGSRDAGTDGPWEAAQVTGNVAVFHADGAYQGVLIVAVDKLPG